MTVRIVSKGAAIRRPFFRRRKSCPFSGPNAPKIDYKDVKLLQRFISERGKIVPAASPRSRPRSSASWPRRSSARATWPCCPTSSGSGPARKRSGNAQEDG